MKLLSDAEELIDECSASTNLIREQRRIICEIRKLEQIDMCDSIQKAKIKWGCNSSFITLTPMVSSPMVVSYFRPINLIGTP